MTSLSHKLGGFGYCFRKEHTYVTLWQSPEGQQVELCGKLSKPVPNLFAQDNGDYVMWILVKELEREI